MEVKKKRHVHEIYISNPLMKTVCEHCGVECYILPSPPWCRKCPVPLGICMACDEKEWQKIVDKANGV